MTVDKIQFSVSTALTITLDALAASLTVGRQSAVVDNGTNLYTDAEVTVNIVTSASALAGSKSVLVYVFGSEDGTNFDQDDAATGGGDAGYTINSPTNLRLAMIINTPTSSKTYRKVFTVASLFNGPMPRKWGLFIANDTGQALGTGNSVTYSGITYTDS